MAPKSKLLHTPPQSVFRIDGAGVFCNSVMACERIPSTELEALPICAKSPVIHAT